MLLQRLQVALPLILLVFLAFFLPGWPGLILFMLFATLMIIGGLYETLKLCGQKRLKLYLVPCLIYALFSLFVTAPITLDDPRRMLFAVDLEILNATFFLLLSFLLTFRFQPDKDSLGDVIRTLATGFYLCWTLTFIPRIYFLKPNGPILLFYLVLITKIADVGAYFVGSLTAKLPGGNHKLSRLVSPNKSWEGLLGGIVFSLVASLVYWHFLNEKMCSSAGFANIFEINRLDAIVLGLAAPVVGLIGDLAESVMKRAAGAKDSGHIPGLGGVLDMLDSLIPMAPFFFGYFFLKPILSML